MNEKGKFEKVIFAKTKLLTKITKVFFILKAEKPKKKTLKFEGYQYFVLRNCRQTMRKDFIYYLFFHYEGDLFLD